MMSMEAGRVWHYSVLVRCGRRKGRREWRAKVGSLLQFGCIVKLLKCVMLCCLRELRGVLIACCAAWPKVSDLKPWWSTEADRGHPNDSHGKA